MIPAVREKFNKEYKEEFYENLLSEVLETFGEECGFRISETPVFIASELKKKVFDACDSIIEQIWKLDLDKVREDFVPKDIQSPAPLRKPHFLAIDFGLCDDGKGGIEPQLIELQAFPTLFFYQPFLGNAFLKNYPNIPKKGFHYYFSGLTNETYKEEVRNVIIGDTNPENVILMELYPEKQKTSLDFWATKQALGIEVVCMTKVIKEGKKLFYEKDGQKISIKKIYNRVIFDEISNTKDLKTDINLNDDLDVEWVTHPDWFYIISKCILPKLKHQYIPQSFYLNDYPSDIMLENYVLKPLFSFAGKGINLHPTQKEIDAITDKHNYILQKKVQYSSLVKTPTEKNSKVELRILYIWDDKNDKLKPVINLTRMSKGELINVSHLTQDTWIGSSISFFED